MNKITSTFAPDLTASSTASDALLYPLLLIYVKTRNLKKIPRKICLALNRLVIPILARNICGALPVFIL